MKDIFHFQRFQINLFFFSSHQLSPTQVMVVPVGPSLNDYASSVRDQLRVAGYRADADLDDGCTMNKKIRNAQLGLYNFILVVGEQERTHSTVNVRTRDNRVHGQFNIPDLVTKFQRFCDERIKTEDEF